MVRRVTLSIHKYKHLIIFRSLFPLWLWSMQYLSDFKRGKKIYSNKTLHGPAKVVNEEAKINTIFIGEKVNNRLTGNQNKNN